MKRLADQDRKATVREPRRPVQGGTTYSSVLHHYYGSLLAPRQTIFPGFSESSPGHHTSLLLHGGPIVEPKNADLPRLPRGRSPAFSRNSRPQHPERVVSFRQGVDSPLTFGRVGGLE